MYNKTIHLYTSFKKNYLRFKTYLKLGRFHAAPIEPFRLLEVAPNRITHRPREKPLLDNGLTTGVKGGEWDLDKSPLSVASPSYKSIKQHFEDGIPWESTEEYQIGLRKIENSDYSFGVSSWGPCKSVDDLNRRFAAIDRLYEQIRRYGYRTQAELLSDKADEMVEDLKKDLYSPPELKEIAVYIDRDGEFLWKEGIHRLAIAQVLDIEKIPVYVYVRHQLWQDFRDELYSQNDPSHEHSHPDLNF